METQSVDIEIPSISQEELAEISQQINQILEKYDAEIKVSSQIHVLKRSPTVEDVTNKEDGNKGEESEQKANTEATEGSESDN